MSLNLDEIDYRILMILRDNARASISEISRKLGLSRPTVRQRIRKLMERGVIRKFTVVTDESLERGIQVIVGFKTSDVKWLLDELEKINEFSEIYVTSGERNVICKAKFPDIKTFKDLMDRFVGLNVPFETNIILRTIKEKWESEPKLSFKLKCDYCGNEITGKPYTYTMYNRGFNFCCPTCLREFRRIRETY